MSGLMRKNRLLGIKLESTVGEDSVPAAANCIFKVYDYQPSPEIEYAERESGGSASRSSGSLGARGGGVNFKLQLYGSGSGGSPVPGWADVILPSLGLIKSSATFAPLTGAPGTSAATHRTASIYVWEDGRVKKHIGCMANAKLICERGRVAYLDLAYKGVWAGVAAAATPTSITRDSVAPPRFVSAGLSIGSWTPLFDKVELDLGNDVQLREDGNSAYGYSSAFIADRSPRITIAPEAALIATNDTYGQWLALTGQEIAWDVGSAAGNKMTVTCPNCEFENIQDGERAGATVDQITARPLLDDGDGDDELTITFVGS